MTAIPEGSGLPINPERIQKLLDYGLTEYQARVYLTLLDLGTATASQLPASSRVPRTRIYQTMQQLHGKGLVQVLPEKPTRYRAVPFTAYARFLAEDYRTRARRIETSLDVLARDFSVAITGIPDTKGRFEALYGRRNVRERLGEMIEGAKREIIGVGSNHSPGRILRAFAPELGDRRRAGVDIRLAFHVEPENAEEVRGLARIADVRSVDFFLPVCRYGVDGREFLMSHPIPDDDSTYRGEDIAIWTDDPAIAGAMAQMAELIWEMGKAMAPARAPPKRARLTSSAES